MRCALKYYTGYLVHPCLSICGITKGEKPFPFDTFALKYRLLAVSRFARPGSKSR